MTTLTIWTGNNTQEILVSALADSHGAMVSSATLSATLKAKGATVGTISFVAVIGVAGSYSGTLSGFNEPTGSAIMYLSGSNTGNTFSYEIPCVIAERSL
jgi:hypothetical protein